MGAKIGPKSEKCNANVGNGTKKSTKWEPKSNQNRKKAEKKGSKNLCEKKVPKKGGQNRKRRGQNRKQPRLGSFRGRFWGAGGFGGNGETGFDSDVV